MNDTMDNPMMQVTFEKDPARFLRRCGSYLEKNEAEHSLILSLCQTAEQRAAKGEKVDLSFSTLYEDDDLVVAAAQTPTRNLILSKAALPEVEKLAEALANQNFRFPGIIGPSDVAASFSNRWTSLTGQKSVEYMDQIVYSLTTVSFPPKIEGVFRLAKTEETGLMASWLEDFAKNALPKADFLTPDAAMERAERFIGENQIAVWDIGGKPVAMAAVSFAKSVARIGSVYTPTESRGHGYASAVVAHLSQQQLDQGKKMCCLYADARNPVSNSIYRKLGYEFVGRSSLYVLDHAA